MKQHKAKSASHAHSASHKQNLNNSGRKAPKNSRKGAEDLKDVPNETNEIDQAPSDAVNDTARS